MTTSLRLLLRWWGSTPPPCDNCHHPYGEHTGRSYIRRGVIGPADRFHWGSSCSNPGDGIHSCPCSEWMLMVDGRRETQRSLSKSRGQAMVEFALVLPIFLFMVFAFIDGGRWIYTQNALTNATHDAVRGITVQAARECLPTDSTAACASKIVAARVFAVGGPVVTTTTCLHWVGADPTTVPLAACTEDDWFEVTAVVNPWQVITPIASSILTPTISVSARGEIHSLRGS